MNLVAKWPPAPALVSPQPAHVWVSLSDTDGTCTLGHGQGQGQGLCWLEDLCSIKSVGYTITHPMVGKKGQSVSWGGQTRFCDLLLADTSWSMGLCDCPLTHGTATPPQAAEPSGTSKWEWVTAACSSFCRSMGASMGGEAGLGSDKDLVPGRRGISCGFGGERTLPAVPGWGKEKGACSSSKEQRPRSGLFVFQRGHISKM